MDFDLSTLVLDLFLTFISFTLFPFVRFFKKREFYTYKEIKTFNIINSVVIQLILAIILIMAEEKINILPAFIYYFFNQWLWTREKKPKKQYNKENYHENNNNADNNFEESESDIMKLLNSDRKNK